MSRRQRLIENLGVEFSNVFSLQYPPDSIEMGKSGKRLLLIVLIALLNL